MRAIKGWLGCMVMGLLLQACSSAAPVRLYEGAARSAQEIAVLSLPEALEVARINGVQVRGLGGLLRGGDRTLELAPGRYELLVFYRDIWDQTGEHESLRSDPVLFVLEAQAGHRYVVDFDRPRSLEQAKALAAHFSGWIQDASTLQRIVSQPSGMRFSGGLLGGLSGSTTLERDPGQEAAQLVVQPLAAPPATAPAPSSVTATPAGSGNADYPALMRAWWNQATAEERRAFLRWVGETPQER